MDTIRNKRSRKSVKAVINRNFTFADLSPRFKNVDSSTGNIFCPFHENHSTPAAKMYWWEEQGIWVIHCFGECHRNFTAYDYVKRILCDQYQKYRNPLEFLKQNMPHDELYMQLDAYEKMKEDQVASEMNVKMEHIMQIAAENENISDFIEALYLA